MSARIEQLVQRRVREWEQQWEAAGRVTVGKQRPAIAISRATAAGGRTVGKAAAELLGARLYDRSLVDEIARSASVRQRVVESVDDSVRDSISNWIGENFQAGYFTHSDYLQHLGRVLLTLARQERVLVLGRGASFILDPARTLRVRITAPLGLRVERYAAREQVDAARAHERIVEQDARRIEYCRHHFKQDPTLPEHYDLVLNTAALRPDVAASLIASAFRARFE